MLQDENSFPSHRARLPNAVCDGLEKSVASRVRQISWHAKYFSGILYKCKKGIKVPSTEMFHKKERKFRKVGKQE